MMKFLFGSKTAYNKAKDLVLFYDNQMELRRTGKNLCPDKNKELLWHANHMELWRTRPDLWNKLPAEFRLNFIPY